MASTVFQDYNQNTPIVAAWLNDVNKATYTEGGSPKTVAYAPAAWVRFSAVGGTVVIQQSVNVSSVVRSATGVYTITYGSTLTNTTNCYDVTQNAAGFQYPVAETDNSVTINFANPSATLIDPGFASVIVFGNF